MNYDLCMPIGETTITYQNNDYIITNLNDHGHVCGVQEHYDKNNEKISLKHEFINPNLEWTKAKNSTFYIFDDENSIENVLTKSFESYYVCQHLGKLFGIHCQEILMEKIDGFPMSDF